jgi:hypothetical protein
MDNDAKIKRALYMKGILRGKTATIELTIPIGARNAAKDYIHVAEKGDRVQATMEADGWVVTITETDGDEVRTVNIPLACGKVR